MEKSKKDEINYNDFLFQDQQDTLKLSQVVSLVMALLGLTMSIFHLLENNIPMLISSLIYGPLFLLSFIVTKITKKMNFFFVTALTLSFVMEIVYLLLGGQDGFGIYWMLIITFFTYFIGTTKVFTILNSIYLFLIILGFWTPLSNFCYPFSFTTKTRFPILYTVEILFAAFIKIKLQKTQVQRSQLIEELTSLKNSLSDQVEERTKELIEEKNISTNLLYQVTEALATTIDAKDKYTSGHSRRVAQYSEKIAKEIGFSEQDQGKIYLIALLHDIGKIGIPDEIINKRDTLSDDEYALVKKHPEIGFEILKNITTMPDFEIGVRWHHERFDGKGYPDHLSNDRIPLFAQIISVADSYDAMTSNRSYRSYLPQDKVRSELLKEKGKQFAPEIADIMIKLIDADVDYVMHE